MRITEWQKGFGKFSRKGVLALARKMKDPSFRYRMSRMNRGESNPAKLALSRKAISEGQKRAWRNKKIRARRTAALQKSWDRNWEERVARVYTEEFGEKISRALKGKNPGSWSRRPGEHLYVGKQGRMVT